MLQVYDRSQEWTDENRTCPSASSPSAVQDAKEVRLWNMIIFWVFFFQSGIKQVRFHAVGLILGCAVKFSRSVILRAT